MSKQILLFLLSCMLLPPGAAIAQGMTPNYRGDSTFAWVDNVPNCLGTAVCWHGLNGTGALNAVSVYSGNGCVFAIDSNHIAHQYNEYPSNSWTTHSEYGQVYGIGCGGDGHIYALYGPGGGSCINQGYHSLGQWSGTSWTQMTYCFASFAISQDAAGMILLVDGNGTLWYTTGFGAGGYQHSPSAPFPVISATAINGPALTYEAVKSDHTLWGFNGSTWSQIPNSSVLQVASDFNGTIYALGTDNFVYHWNGTGWNKLSGGTKSSLANGGVFHVLAIGTLASGNTVYRLPDYTVRHTRTLSGSATCAIGCGTAMHTGHVQAGWGTSLGTQVNSSSVTPTTNINISSPADILDPFTCFENPDLAGCLPSGGENVGCTQVGNIFSSNASGGTAAKHFEIAYGRALATSHVPQPHSWKYTVTNHCNSINPDLIPGVNIVNYLTYDPNMVAFDIEAGCYSFTGGRPWTCAAIPNYGITVQAGYPTDPGYKDNCTENP